MLLAHLPAGYILTTKLQKYLKTSKYLLLGLIGSIGPDFDYLYYYFFDNPKSLHHTYWTHTPIYWFVITIIVIIFFYLIKNKEYLKAVIIFFSNIFLHLILDTIVGRIAWLYPLSNKSFELFDVPPIYNYYIFSVIFNWTFIFEILIISLAIFTYIYRRYKKQ